MKYEVTVKILQYYNTTKKKKRNIKKKRKKKKRMIKITKLCVIHRL